MAFCQLVIGCMGTWEAISIKAHENAFRFQGTHNRRNKVMAAFAEKETSNPRAVVSEINGF